MAPVKDAFSCVERIPLAALDAELHCYNHQSGFQHFHIATSDPHRSASLAVRTLPIDNSGLPHILEHSVLCGSERFPVRDPFFMMLRRSMQTFMNAMTGADCTWYPIASLNEEDFFNLFAVYCDAVFAPRLHDLDIAQEAWRWTINDDTPAISGVVFNEMKGAYADRDTVLYQALCSNMLPDTPYRFDSGGDPCAIPDLSAEDVRAFHKQHYRPANTCCCSYGALDVSRLHEQLSVYLVDEGFEREPIPLQQQAYIHREIQVDTPVDPESIDQESLICAWLWGDGSDPLHNMLSSILEDLLIGHAAAPLRLTLESSGLCQSIDGSGFLDYCRNGIMSIEMHGCKLSDKQQLLELVDSCIDRVIQDNFPLEDIKAAIKQNELHERYIGGDREPFGLQLCESLIDAWNYNQSPALYLDSESLFRDIRQQLCQNPRLFSDLLQHYARGPERQQLVICSKNDLNFFQRYIENEERRRSSVIAETGFQQKTQRFNQALQERQATIDDPRLLPQLQLSDIQPQTIERSASGPWIQTLSNGLSQLSYFYPVAETNIQKLKFYSQCLSELGYAQRDYQETARHINQLCGALHAALQFWHDHNGDIVACLNLDAWGLSSDSDHIAELIMSLAQDGRTDESARIQELLIQQIQQIKERVISSGNSYASLQAAQFCHPLAYIQNQTRGLPYLQYLAAHNQEENILHDCKAHPTESDRYLFECSDVLTLSQSFAWSDISSVHAFPVMDCEIFQMEGIKDTAYVINSEVQFNAVAFKAPGWQHPDAAVLYVLGQLLGNLYLHPEIREAGGAYGASAYYSSQQHAFICSTYRDPHIDRSFEVIQDSIQKLLQHKIRDMELEEAIISSLAELQKPGSPFSDSKRFIMRALRSEDAFEHIRFQEQIKSCTPADIRRVTQHYLLGQPMQKCTLANEQSLRSSKIKWHVQTMLGVTKDS